MSKMHKKISQNVCIAPKNIFSNTKNGQTVDISVNVDYN